MVSDCLDSESQFSTKILRYVWDDWDHHPNKRATLTVRVSPLSREENILSKTIILMNSLWHKWYLIANKQTAGIAGEIAALRKQHLPKNNNNHNNTFSWKQFQKVSARRAVLIPKTRTRASRVKSWTKPQFVPNCKELAGLAPRRRAASCTGTLAVGPLIALFRPISFGLSPAHKAYRYAWTACIVSGLSEAVPHLPIYINRTLISLEIHRCDQLILILSRY